MKFLIAVLVPFLTLFAQQPDTGGSTAGKMEVKFGVSSYNPDFATLNTGFSDLEKQFGFRPWGSSSLPYSAFVEARYPLFPQQWVIVEVAGSGVKRIHEDDRSVSTVWRVGPGYRFEFLELPVRVGVQGSVGFVWASFSRTYNSNAAVINAAGNSWYVSVAGTGAYRLTPWSSVELSLGYLFVSSFKAKTPDAEVDMKSPVAGLGFVVDF